MRRLFGARRYAGLAGMVAVAAAMCIALVGARAGHTTPVTGAGFTTVDETVDGPGHCANGNPATNCNIYDGKQYVWLNGGPSTAYVGDGSYFFAVLDPGGQRNPNDGKDQNLSSPWDTYANRTFTVTNGVVSYSGSHDVDGNKIRLMPYDDTTNPGGVYIMAICSLADGYPVTPSDCKYDAFKIKEANPPVTPPAAGATVSKDAAGAYDDTYSWNIAKSQNPASPVSTSSKTVTATYTVHLTHDAGTDSNYSVSGTISVFNPNIDVDNEVVPMEISGLTDSLSDGTDCTVTGAPDNSNPTVALTQFQTDFAYSCTLGGAPHAQLDNRVEVDWPTQDLNLSGDASNLSHLEAGFDTMTFESIVFTANPVDDCTTVSDQTPAGGTSSDSPFATAVCVGESGDGGAGTDASSGFTWTYHVTYPVTADHCVAYTNTASESTDGGSSSVHLTVCGPAAGGLTMGFWQNKNGQGIITGASQPSLKAFLTGYHPFQDYPQKSGQTIAAYVLNVINSASCTSTDKTCNSMLKAQMLATALDVYFSQGGAVGDPIAKYNGGNTTSLGDVKVNLTNPENTSAAFGGATCLSVSDLLGYANQSQGSSYAWGTTYVSNAGGANWYGQLKATQVLAKDTFDSINNQAAFTCT